MILEYVWHVYEAKMVSSQEQGFLANCTNPLCGWHVDHEIGTKEDI